MIGLIRGLIALAFSPPHQRGERGYDDAMRTVLETTAETTARARMAQLRAEARAGEAEGKVTAIEADVRRLAAALGLPADAQDVPDVFRAIVEMSESTAVLQVTKPLCVGWMLGAEDSQPLQRTEDLLPVAVQLWARRKDAAKNAERYGLAVRKVACYEMPDDEPLSSDTTEMAQIRP